MNIQLKRAYDDPSESDGYRVLVDRLWPRGISKKQLRHDVWIKDIAPSDELRKWFDHDPGKFRIFREKYTAELDENPEPVHKLISIIRSHQTVTLVYAARDQKHNNAVVLKEYLERHPG